MEHYRLVSLSDYCHIPKYTVTFFIKTTVYTMNITIARLAQSVERKTFNLVVVGSSPTAGTRVVTLSNSGEKVSLVSPQWRNWIAHQTSNLGVVGSSPTWGILQGGRKW